MKRETPVQSIDSTKMTVLKDLHLEFGLIADAVGPYWRMHMTRASLRHHYASRDDPAVGEAEQPG